MTGGVGMAGIIEQPRGLATIESSRSAMGCAGARVGLWYDSA